MNECISHTDFTNGYRIKYPGDWEKQALTPTLTVFLAPRESPSDVFRENVNVSAEEIAVTLSQHVDLQVNMMQSTGWNFQLTDRSDTQLAGLPAQTLEFNGRL